MLKKEVISLTGQIGKPEPYTLEFAVSPQDIIIEAYEYDMKSGKIVNLIQIPVRVK